MDLIAEYDGAGNVLRRYVHGPGTDEPLVWYEGSGTGDRRFLHADERGSITSTTDNSGNTINVTTYDEYGAASSSNVAYAGRFGFTGQTWIPEVGLNYYKARLYSPILGRFLQADPIGYGDGLNLYAYVGNDPVNAVDPSGLNSMPNADGGGLNPNVLPPIKPGGLVTTVIVYGKKTYFVPNGAVFRVLNAGSISKAVGNADGMPSLTELTSNEQTKKSCPAKLFKVTGVGPEQAKGKSSFTHVERSSLPSGSVGINTENFGVAWPKNPTPSFLKTLSQISFSVDWATAYDPSTGRQMGVPKGIGDFGPYLAVGNLDWAARQAGDNHIDIYDFKNQSNAYASTRMAKVTVTLPSNNIGLKCPE